MLPLELQEHGQNPLVHTMDQIFKAEDENN